MSAPGPWADDLFPFPTPPGLRTLIDIAWEELGGYDDTLLETHYDFMFDLVQVPGQTVPRRPLLPHYATPEFVAFGALGDGGYVGWLVPAPELDRPDHPVALANGHEPGVTYIGANTNAGLEFMLSWTLRRWRAAPADRPTDEQRLARLAAELDVRPDPDGTFPGSAWNGTAVRDDPSYQITFDVPPGYRHAPGTDNIGVLAPTSLWGAATTLQTVKNTFADNGGADFAELRAEWSRSYHALDRPQYADHLNLMTPYYS